MTVKELVEKYKKNRNMMLDKELSVKKYIPVMRKYEIAQNVFAASVTVKNGLIEVDSLKKYLCFTTIVLSEYTNLEFSDEGAIEEYDMLCEVGLIDAIIGTFKEDYNRTLSVLNNLFADEIANHNTVESILASLSQSIAKSVDGIADVMKDKIESFDGSNIDMSGIEEIMNILGNK